MINNHNFPTAAPQEQDNDEQKLVDKNYSEPLQKAFLDAFIDALPVASLHDSKRSKSYYEFTKLPAGEIEAGGTYDWQNSTLYLPTPSLQKDKVKSMLIDRTSEEEAHLERVSNAFMAVGNQSNKLNKTIKQAANRTAGVYEVLNNFSSFHTGLTQAFKSAGFKHRKDYFGKLQLIVNLFKRFSEQDFEAIRAKADDQDHTLTKFFEIQTWEATSERLRDSTLDFTTPGINAGNVINLKNCVQSGDKEDPSIIFPLSKLIPKEGDAVVQQLLKWFNEGGVDFYMIKFVCDIPSNRILTETEQEDLIQNLRKFIKALSKNSVDLLSFINTRNVLNQRYKVSTKLIDVFFTSLLSGKLLSSQLRKLDVSRNYIGYETFKHLSVLLQNAPHLKDLNISGLRLGEATQVVIEEIHPTEEGKPAGCCSCFGRCFNACFGCCCYRCCLPTNPKLNYNSLDSKLKEVVSANDLKVREFLASGNDLLTPLISTLEARAGRGGHLQTVIVADFPFTSFTQDAAMVERFCTAIARCRPFAVSFADSLLSDKNQLAMAALFYENPSLLHLNLTGTMLYSLESWSHLQKLIQSSPLIISMPISESIKKHIQYTYVSEPHHSIKTNKKKAGCCKSIPEHHYTLCQKVEKRTFDFAPLAEDLPSIDVIRSAIQSETTEHRLMPYHKVFQQMFAHDPKKLKVLNDLMTEEEYMDVFSRAIENEKEQAFTKFKEDIRHKAEANANTGDNLNASVILDYNDIWKIDVEETILEDINITLKEDKDLLAAMNHSANMTINQQNMAMYQQNMAMFQQNMANMSQTK